MTLFINPPISKTVLKFYQLNPQFHFTIKFQEITTFLEHIYFQQCDILPGTGATGTNSGSSVGGSKTFIINTLFTCFRLHNIYLESVAFPQKFKWLMCTEKRV